MNESDARLPGTDSPEGVQLLEHRWMECLEVF